MKQYFFIASLFLIFTACKNQGTEAETATVSTFAVKNIPNKVVDKKDLFFDKQTSLWYANDKLFSGYAVSNYENDTLMQKIGILDGMKQNETLDYYPNGTLKSSSSFYAGKLHGAKRVWDYDTAHTLVAQLNFENGNAQGEQKKWYPTGEIFQILNMKDGREEGIQKAFRKNGALYANYEAKNGRIFGMKKAKLCFGLENQKIINEDN